MARDQHPPAGVPLRARVVEVRADLGPDSQPRYRFGSGLRIGGRLVLTAAHVVTDAPAGGVGVLGTDKVRHEATVLRGCLGDPATVDLALLELPASIAELPALRLAAVNTEAEIPDLIERCWAVGYPQFQEIDGPDRPVRETAQASGVIPPGENMVGGLLSLQVTHAPRELPDAGQTLAQTPWAGMSGAAVFARDQLIGVVTEHAPRRGAGTITVTPLTHLNRLPAATASRWWSLLGVADPGQLPLLPEQAARTSPPYLATLRDYRDRTPVLVGREHELAQIRAFATGGPCDLAPGGASYAWLTAGPWSGKSALLAEAVHDLPGEVACVCYFLVRRVADADREKFLVAVIPQLAAVLGANVPDRLDVHVFRDLWQRAVVACAQDGRRLLLVVDGLDEDMGPAGASLAAWLPVPAPGDPARVLVSSRDDYAIPAEVDVGHPLRLARRWPLAGNPQAVAVQALADQEIEQLLAGYDDLTYELLGLLAAAAGPLTEADLAELSGATRPAVRQFTAVTAARTLHLTSAEGPRRYAFAHLTLLDRCRAHDLVGDPGFARKLDAWADDWQRRGWPAAGGAGGTPLYLLDSYPAALARSVARRRGVLTDPGWIETAVLACGVDAVLADLRAAADERIGDMLRAVTQRSFDLRAPGSGRAPGDVIRMVALQALAEGHDSVAAACADRLRALPAAQLVPLWTNRRAATALIRDVGQHPGRGTDVAVSQDGRFIISAGDGRLLRWDIAASAPAVQIASNLLPVARIAVAGRWIIAADADGAIRRWNPDDPGDGIVIGQAGSTIRAIVASAGAGQVITGDDDGQILRWALDVPADPVTLGQHEGAVKALAISADGQFVVSGGDDNRILRWPAAAAGQPVQIGTQLHTGVVAVSPDSRYVVSGGHDGVILRWDLAQPGIPAELGRHAAGAEFWAGGHVGSLAFTPDGRRVLSGGDDFRIVVRTIDMSVPALELGKHDFWVAAVAIAPGGEQAVSIGHDGRILLWGLTASPGRRPGPAHTEGWVRSVAITPDGRSIIGGADWQVCRWSIAGPGPAERIGVHGYAVSEVAVTRDGRKAVSGCQGGSLTLWDLDAPGTSRELGFQSGGITSLTITPDGKHVVTGGDHRRVWRWDLARRRKSVPLGPEGSGCVYAVVATPDGRHVVSGDNEGRVALHDLADPGRRTELGQLATGVFELAVTADGRYVLSGAADGSIVAWDLREPGRRAEAGLHGEHVGALAVTPDGRHILSGGLTRIRLWDAASYAAGGSAPTRVSALAVHQAPGEARTLVAEGTSTGLTVWELTGIAR